MKSLLLAALALPLLAGPKDAGFVDGFTTEQFANRRLMRGEWSVAGGVARVTQDDALYKQFKNHGPIVFYDLPMGDVRVSFEVRLEDAKRFIFTFNGKGGHVFRLLQNEANAAALAFEDKDGKHASVRLDTALPHVRNGEWVRYEIELRGEQAAFSIGDTFRKTVKHATLAKEKSNLSLSFHYGTIQIRGLRVELL
jgi:hypothetical protein